MFRISSGLIGSPSRPTCDCRSRLAASSFSLSSDGSCPASGTASSGAGAGAAEGAAEGAAAVAARLAEFSLVKVNLRQVFNGTTGCFKELKSQKCELRFAIDGYVGTFFERKLMVLSLCMPPLMDID